MNFNMIYSDDEIFNYPDKVDPAKLLKNQLILFQEKNFEETQKFAESIYKEVIKQIPAIVELSKRLNKETRYVVDLSKESINAIENGIIKLAQENGHTYAQLKMNGKYSSKIPIKKEVYSENIDPAQLANALQVQCLQEAIEEISDQLILINDVVKEIAIGQQNDRIGLYYSGLSLFLESQSISDINLKNSLISQSLRALSEASFQLKLALETDINYIKNEEFKKVKGKSSALITEHINKIDQSFAFIHRAYLLRAAIYCSAGEFLTMTRILDEYSYFIESDIKNNAVMLSQYDKNDDGTSEGLWMNRTKLQLDTKNIIKQLNNPYQMLYISIE